MTDVRLEHYHPMRRECQQNPFPYYAVLREQAPVHLHPELGIYFVSRMEDVGTVLRDPQTFSSRFATTGALPRIPGKEAEVEALRARTWPAVDTMLTADPPIQTRYRKAVARAFNPKRIAAFTDDIRTETDRLIDAWPMDGRIDYLATFSVPLPVRVIARVLSIPLERDGDVKQWSDASVAGLGESIEPDEALRAASLVVSMQQFLAELVESRRERPDHDFLTELVEADFDDPSEGPRKLQMPEMLSILQQLLVAGNETTTKSINEITKLLIENPEAWKQIREDPSKVPAVVEEGLRLASPNQGLMRIATRDTELRGVTIPKGSRVWVMFGSANRDETVFPDPDRFDPHRENLNEHVAFGRGAHFCIGAPLARLELRVVFERLAERVERLAFSPGNDFAYAPSFILRGLAHLEIDTVRRT